ncbi:phage virion morphogenesis protein, partial [Ruixingdingia sedimenti]
FKMTGISIEVELRNEELREALRGMLLRMDRRQPFMAAVGERMLSSTKDRFATETDPDGRAWKPLRPATIKARQRKGQLPLTILRSNSKGKIGSSLAGSINYIATEDEVRIGSPVAHAAIHQLGGTIQRQARKAKIYRVKDDAGQIGRRFVKKSAANHVTDVDIPAHSITIPARPFLGLTAADEAAILEDAEDWLTP